MNTFKVQGSGPNKVLLFHGLMGDASTFDSMLSYADVERFQYVVMDCRGYGNSRNCEGAYTIGEIADDGRRLIKYLGWHRYFIGGHSMGSLAAQMIALSVPEQVRGILSIAGMSASGGSRDKARQLALLEASTAIDRRAEMIHAATARQYSKTFSISLADAGRDSILPRAFAAYASSAASTDISAAVDGSRIPFLALVGELDPNNPPEAIRNGSARWYLNTHFQILNAIGHYPMIEAPIRTITALENFMLLDHLQE
jgi:pimeloyl-ACP methyl ester carboxylesterase